MKRKRSIKQDLVCPNQEDPKQVAKEDLGTVCESRFERESKLKKTLVFDRDMWNESLWKGPLAPTPSLMGSAS